MPNSVGASPTKDAFGGTESLIRLDSLPTLPSVAGRLIEMALDDRASATEIGELVAKDPALTARLLRVVNSSSYGLRSEVTSVGHAITIIGRQSLRALVLGISIFDTVKESSADAAVDRTALWRHAVACAAAGQLIAQAVGRVNPEEAYIAGLVHDIGMQILAQLRPKEFRRALDAITQSSADSIRASESRECGIDHAELGDRIAERWSLPAGIGAAIRYHHDVASAAGEPTPIRRVVAVTTAADCLAWTCGYPSVDALRPPAADPMTQTLLGRVDRDAAIAAVREEVRKCAEVFRYDEEKQDAWQRSMYKANAELGRLIANQDAAYRTLQSITELILNTQRL